MIKAIPLKLFTCFLFTAAAILINATFCQTTFARHDLITELNFKGKKIYTAYNLWYEEGKEDSLYCINYKRGKFIPAGTEVKKIKYARRSLGAGIGQRRSEEIYAITFKTAHNKKKYYVKIQNTFHPGESLRSYAKLMFTDKNFDQLTEGMNKAEIDSIKKGILTTGMSKEAVLVAYGYPPEHKTYSLENDVWIYWTSRYRYKRIKFDKNGKTYKPSKNADAL